MITFSSCESFVINVDSRRCEKWKGWCEQDEGVILGCSTFLGSCLSLCLSEMVAECQDCHNGAFFNGNSLTAGNGLLSNPFYSIWGKFFLI